MNGWDKFLNAMLPPIDSGGRRHYAVTTSGYAVKRTQGTSPHVGIDCAYGGLHPRRRTVPVYCPVAGIVTQAGGGDYGIIAVRDKNNFSHEFLHSERWQVTVGQEITKVTLISYMSDRGAPNAVHVHYQIRVPKGMSGYHDMITKHGSKVTDPAAYWNGEPIAFLAAGDPNNTLIHEATDQGYNVREENATGTTPGTLYAYQGRQAGVALPQAAFYALWTNRVPQHEPWARTMMVDTENLNANTDQHEYNTSHNPQFTSDNPNGAKLIGRMDGDEEIIRGPFWRR